MELVEGFNEYHHENVAVTVVHGKVHLIYSAMKCATAERIQTFSLAFWPIYFLHFSGVPSNFLEISMI